MLKNANLIRVWRLCRAWLVVVALGMAGALTAGVAKAAKIRVVKGEAELAVQQISELLPVAGTQFVGPFPPELQVYTTFTGAVGPAARDPAAARALLEFLTAPDALPVIKAKGMEPA